MVGVADRLGARARCCGSALAVAAVIAGAGCPGARTVTTERRLPDGRIERTYTELSGAIANPERGLMRVIDLFAPGDVEWGAQGGATLVNAHVRLDEYRDRPLVESFIEDLARPDFRPRWRRGRSWRSSS